MSSARNHCPSCDPERQKSKSLETYENGTRYCFRCHHKSRPCSTCGEVFAYRHPEHERCDACFGVNGDDRGPRPPTPRAPTPRPAPSGDTLPRIWARTVPLRGTIGQAYLERRRCVLPPADSDLRFLPGSDRYPPSLCALVTDAASNKRLSLHFTRLATDGSGKAGTDRDKLLLAGHPKKGGVIRLWPDDAITHGLGIAEGIETALSAAHAYRPVWSTIDAGNMATFPVLPGIESLVVFADNDEAGLSAARACAQRWADAGLESEIRVPARDGVDFNDVVGTAA